mmetsp:Transcript_19981/g.33052  ORF Transcript_19981/g.33052 Transcript_19981/m.33052 type:complete len:91 (-) Transcript_19981:72-344(-)
MHQLVVCPSERYWQPPPPLGSQADFVCVSLTFDEAHPKDGPEPLHLPSQLLLDGDGASVGAGLTGFLDGLTVGAGLTTSGVLDGLTAGDD